MANEQRALEARRLTSKIVSRAMENTGGAPRIGAKLGISHTQVYRMADPDHAASMRLDQVLAVGGEFARTVLTTMLTHVEDGEPVSHDSLDRHTLRLITAVGTVASEVTEALADGQVEPREATAILKAIQKLNDQLARLRRAVEAT